MFQWLARCVCMRLLGSALFDVFALYGLTRAFVSAAYREVFVSETFLKTHAIEGLAISLLRRAPSKKISDPNTSRSPLGIF